MMLEGNFLEYSFYVKDCMSIRISEFDLIIVSHFLSDHEQRFFLLNKNKLLLTRFLAMRLDYLIENYYLSIFYVGLW